MFCGSKVACMVTTASMCIQRSDCLPLKANLPHVLAGYAQMASLVVDWTKNLQDIDESAGESATIAAFDEAFFLRVRHHE